MKFNYLIVILPVLASGVLGTAIPELEDASALACQNRGQNCNRFQRCCKGLKCTVKQGFPFKCV
ncbi:Similar to predicted protein [Phaeodactylum tricornutum CCAP 1055/1]; acc. no. XP_002183007 [Pyronema omphalodes CBS 100304]|uniref:Uncharacterized protein n=1 Tax=Pyronema omphalodes (strain CBS 100304) TaxID=1076935 RepID=U4L2Y5_PYROM|nr:Similar to predicted protein [Phaeodactylum tricornutum CCAP 1055/1]; acc. no. XP_002183007 [Pyronema omphalodes CBS 100304]